MAKDPLQEYRDKRSFSRTPEPAGAQAADQQGRRRFVVQRHRASRLHYDLRFEIDGVLVSWAVPEGPDAGPGGAAHGRARRGPPDGVPRLRGRHPRRRVRRRATSSSGTRGTWEPRDTDDPAAAVAAGELHAEVHGEKLRGRLRAGPAPRPARRAATRSGCCCTSATSTPSPAGTPRTTRGRCSVGRTNEEVAGRPGPRCWRSDLPAAEASSGCAGGPSAARPTTSSPSWTRSAAEGTWDGVRPRRCKVTNLDKELFPGRDDEAAGHQARPAPVRRPGRAGRAALPHRAGAEHAPLPGRRRRARASGTSSCPTHAPEWVARWDNPRPRTPARPRPTSSSTSRPRWCGRPTSARWSGTPGPRAPTRRDQPTYALIDLDPGRGHAVGRRARAGPAAPHGARAPRRPRRSRRSPAGAASRSGCRSRAGPTFDGDPRLGRAALAAPSARWCPELVSWKWEVDRRGGQARLDYTQNAVNKTLVAPYSPRAAAGAPVSVPIDWDELDDPDLRPDGFTAARRTAAAAGARRPVRAGAAAGPDAAGPQRPLTA